MITYGEGRTQVWLEMQNAGEDLVYTLGGGERSHVGGVVLKIPGEAVRTLPIGNHRDLEVLIPIAEAASRRHGKTVVVAGGIHVDNATPEEIRTIVRNCERLAKNL
jgi:hypothetical protein